MKPLTSCLFHVALSRRFLPLASLLLILGGTTLPSSAQVPSRPSTTTAQQLPINARIIYVNPTLGSDAPSAGASEATPYKTISYALQQTENIPQVVIQLARGVYATDSGEVFPLQLRPGVILRGDEPNKGSTTRIIGGGQFISPNFARQNAAVLAAQDSQIRGLTITNPNTRGTAVWVESANPTIRDNTFSESNREGIFVSGTGNPLIEDNIFTANTGNGVSVAVSSQGTIRNNIFRDTGFGIAVSQTATPLIEGNQIVQNQDGVVVSDSATPVLRSNIIESNARDGVVAITNAQPDLGTTSNPGGNLIQNNGRYDIHNATRTNTLLAAGNESQTKQIEGAVDFVGANVNLGTGNFSDVTGHWAADFVTALAERGVISGFPDGTFRPEEPVTRAQFAAIVANAFNPSAKREGAQFVDVGSNFWGYSAIQKSYQGGFMAGYPDGKFEPLLEIPRVQVLVALANGLGYTASTPSVLSVYQDGTAIPDYAVNSVAAATEKRMVVNYSNPAQLQPNRNATRAEVAAFVYQALVNAGQAEPIPSPYIVQPQ